MDRLRSHLLLIFFTFTLLVTGLEAYLSAVLAGIPRDPLRQGDSVIIKCTAFGIESGNQVQLVKQVVSDDLEISDVTIATNNYLHPLYSSLQNSDGGYRYLLHFEEVGDVIEIQFHLEVSILGVEGDDGGFYRCKVGDLYVTPYQYLTINVPLTGVYISQTLPNGTEERVAEGSTVTLEPSVPKGVICNALIDGGYEDPVLKVFVGDVDETEHFRRLEFDHVMSVNGSLNTYHVIQWEKLMYQDAAPAREYHGKQLRCEGYSTGYEYDVLLMYINLIVKFSPDFVCTQYTFMKRVGDVVTIVCTVYANPAASLAFTYNPAGNTAQTTRIDFSQNIQQDGFTITLQDYNGAGMQNLTVLIPVTEESFATEYRLIAENQYGPHTQRFYLNQDYASGGSRLTSTVTAICCSILTLAAFLQR